MANVEEPERMRFSYALSYFKSRNGSHGGHGGAVLQTNAHLELWVVSVERKMWPRTLVAPGYGSNLSITLVTVRHAEEGQVKPQGPNIRVEAASIVSGRDGLRAVPFFSVFSFHLGVGRENLGVTP